MNASKGKISINERIFSRRKAIERAFFNGTPSRVVNVALLLPLPEGDVMSPLEASTAIMIFPNTHSN